MRRPQLPLAALALSLAALPLAAQAPRLGTAEFPTSGARTARPDFLRGLLLLHSFEYEDAAAAFRAAQAKDPGFAMAYWGEAMTFNHGLWNEQAPDSARAVLARLGPTPAARSAKAGTARERAYLAAVEQLYGEGPKPLRDTLYERAMARLAADYPADDEAKLFDALAIMSLSQAVRNVPAYMRAGAIALDVFARRPDHPGAAHYVIHAFDDPVHAPLGLAAARAYARIAPGADHAQHMTTHIFLALGMWRETVAQNAVASGSDRSRWQPGHYTYWHHYGLLQLGRLDSAAAELAMLRDHVAAAPRPRRLAYLAQARAQQVFASARWDDPALGWEVPVPADATNPRAADRFTLGFAALQRGERALAERHAAALDSLRGATPGDFGGLPEVPGILGDELRAALLRADGRTDTARALLQAAGDRLGALPMEFGPPDVVKPPHELLGEWLLADGRPAEAVRAFTRALELMPGRRVALLGLAAAARQSGDLALADDAEGRLRQAAGPVTE